MRRFNAIGILRYLFEPSAPGGGAEPPSGYATRRGVLEQRLPTCRRPGVVAQRLECDRPRSFIEDESVSMVVWKRAEKGLYPEKHAQRSPLKRAGAVSCVC